MSRPQLLEGRKRLPRLAGEVLVLEKGTAAARLAALRRIVRNCILIVEGAGMKSCQIVP
jgi:hypothetical protein